MKSSRWALFLSGRGSTAQAVLENQCNLDIRLVVSSKKKTMGQVRTRRFGVPIIYFGPGMSWESLQQELQRRGIQRIFLLGFMKILPEGFLRSWGGKIVNVHPSLLPAYPGLEAMEKSYQEARGDGMGVTVHIVTSEMDAGPILQQRKLRVPQGLKTGLSFEEAQTRMAFLEQHLVRRVSEMVRFQ